LHLNLFPYAGLRSDDNMVLWGAGTHPALEADVFVISGGNREKNQPLHQMGSGITKMGMHAHF
jgi:hypothetical protein